MTAIQLPAFPTMQALSSLIPTIQSTLQRYASSSTTQNDSETYIATYAKRRAYSTLQNIVWGTDTKIPEEIAQLTLLIARRTTHPIAIHTLIDLSVVYAHSYLDQLQQVFQAQYNLYPLQLTESITNDALPTFIELLVGSDAHRALTSKRKISESIVSFLHACSPIQALIRPFALSKDFILTLASLYDAGLTSTAKFHGGYSVLLSQTIDDADDWPRIWIQTKIALIDSFHIVLTAILDGLSSQSSQVRKEHIFDTLLTLVDLGVAPPCTAPPTPFLNLPLIADYQHSYNLSEKLPSILNESPISPQSERDPRLDLLEATLTSLLSGVEKKNPGLLKIVLRSKMGMKSPVKSESTAAPNTRTSNDTDEESDASLESKTTQILAILPHLSPSHVDRLLRDDRLGGNVERVLEGLLDGSLSEWEDVDQAEERREEGSGKGKQRAKSDEERGDAFGYDVAQRRNIFDTEELDATRVRVGKQDVGFGLLQDRSTIERMKRDVLRRVKEMDEAEAEFEEEDTRNWKYKAKGQSDAVYDEDEIGVGAASSSMGRIRLLGDGESDNTDDSDSDSDDSGAESGTLDPETIIEQAYLRDPSVFDRDPRTRRGISRIELRKLTGWADEQIEGWKVMLERTPGKKAKLEEKHAFRGNVKGLEVHGPSQSRSSGFSGRGRRPPRGGAGGNGGGESSRGIRRGRGGGGSNRKRGHDRKIAKAGGGTA